MSKRAFEWRPATRATPSTTDGEGHVRPLPTYNAPCSQCKRRPRSPTRRDRLCGPCGAAHDGVQFVTVTDTTDTHDPGEHST